MIRAKPTKVIDDEGHEQLTENEERKKRGIADLLRHDDHRGHDQRAQDPTRPVLQMVTT